jgi:hypothetical protein
MNCLKAASSALPDKPSPNNVAEADVPSFSYSAKFSRPLNETDQPIATDIGARDHGHVSEISRCNLGRSANGGEATRSNRRLP